MDLFANNKDPNALDYDFKLSSGKMICSNKNNTIFKFDTEENTILGDIYNIVADEKNDITKEIYDSISGFCAKVAKHIEFNCKGRIIEKLRLILKMPEEIMPLKTIHIFNFSIDALPETDYVIVVEKNSPKNHSTPRVSDELFKIHLETGKPLNTIIEEKKNSGDTNYKYVQSASKRKFYYQCQLDLYVDYSLTLQDKDKK
jgi:hypothetical protein